MKKQDQDYSLFFKFLRKFTPTGFKKIDSNSKKLLDLNHLMEQNNQFLYVADMIKRKVLYTSKQSVEMLGIKPENVTPYYFMDATHPDDIQRLSLGRTKLIKTAQDLFISGKGTALASTTFKIRNSTGDYSNYLIQGYLYYTTIPYKTVFLLKIHTNIDWFKNLKNGYHYYIGNDFSYFKFPDKALLRTGNVFSKRQFEIIKLIAAGNSTEQIAKILSISIYTVNTHRGKLLKKTKKENISALIYELMEKGLL